MKGLGQKSDDQIRIQRAEDSFGDTARQVKDGSYIFMQVVKAETEFYIWVTSF